MTVQLDAANAAVLARFAVHQTEAVRLFLDALHSGGMPVEMLEVLQVPLGVLVESTVRTTVELIAEVRTPEAND